MARVVQKKCELDVQKKLELPMELFCDPNGIRTSVTAVKGRCPRPLDDRVGSAANIGSDVIDARQIGGRIQFVSRETAHSAVATGTDSVRESELLRAQSRLDARSRPLAHFARDA